MGSRVFEDFDLRISEAVLQKINDRGICRLDVEVAVYTSDAPIETDDPKHVPPETWLLIGRTLDGERIIEVYVTPYWALKVLKVKTAFLLEY